MEKKCPESRHGCNAFESNPRSSKFVTNGPVYAYVDYGFYVVLSSQERLDSTTKLPFFIAILDYLMLFISN